MPRDPIPTWFFVLVVVRREDRFLLVHETTHGQLWYLPAGRVEPGEDLIIAARRETLEESGIPVQVDGIIRIEHTPTGESYARVRVIFSAHPEDDTPPKKQPDKESLEAGWFTLEEVKSLPLRGYEVYEIFSYTFNGGMIAPLSLIAREGSPFSV